MDAALPAWLALWGLAGVPVDPLPAPVCPWVATPVHIPLPASHTQSVRHMWGLGLSVSRCLSVASDVRTCKGL